jgi:hypothetical protein
VGTVAATEIAVTGAVKAPVSGAYVGLNCIAEHSGQSYEHENITATKVAQINIF